MRELCFKLGCFVVDLSSAVTLAAGAGWIAGKVMDVAGPDDWRQALAFGLVGLPVIVIALVTIVELLSARDFSRRGWLVLNVPEEGHEAADGA